MAGRGGGGVRRVHGIGSGIGISGVGGQGPSPRAAASSRSTRFVTNSVSLERGGLVGLSARCDKTVCQYCGVSYLTMSEMRSLQTTVKDQEERLSHYKTILQENVRLKDLLGNIRKTHVGELIKKEEQTQRAENVNTSLQAQIDLAKKEAKDAQLKYLDIQQKYAISAEDSRQQEDLISQLRDQIQDKSDTLAENSALRDKVKNLESALHKVLVQFREVAGSSFSEKSGRLPLETGDHLRAKLHGSDLMKPEPAEWGNWRSAQQKPYQQSGDSGAKPKIGSVATIETHDLRRQIALLSEKLRSLTEEHSNCADMHAFLRETVDKLKTDNMKLHESSNCLKMKHEERVMESSNLEAKLEGVLQENARLKGVAKQMENQLRSLGDQNMAIKKAHDPKLVENLQKTVAGLQRQFQQQRRELEELNAEFEVKLGGAQRETAMEKERADTCLASSLSEREGVEKRWEERWDRHQSSLNEQLDALKASHEETLRKTKEHEVTLEKELKILSAKFEKSKEGWETYRKTLQDQVGQWKAKYEQKQRDLDSTRKGKVDVEVLYQDKTKDLEMLQEMVRDGCEERHELQKKIRALEESLEEMASRGTNLQRFYVPPPTIPPQHFAAKEQVQGFSSPAGFGSLKISPIGPSNLKYSSSESMLPIVNLPGNSSTNSSWSSLGMVALPPGSSSRPSDLSVSSMQSSAFFTVGKGNQKPAMSVHSTTSSGKDKNAAAASAATTGKIGQQKGGSGGTTGTSTTTTATPSRKSNK